MKLYRGHGLGNDYLVLEDPIALNSKLVRAICDRHRGVGGDGILEPISGEQTDYGVRIWNPDGSIAEKSGNGLRIYAAWLRCCRNAASSFTVWTGFDCVRCSVDEDMVEIDMGKARFHPDDLPVISDTPIRDELWTHGDMSLPVTAVSMGNPHCVAFSSTPLDRLAWRSWGAHWEQASRFPNRTNVQVARILSTSEVAIRIWERGAGETLSSGSSSCAVAAAGVETGRLSAGWITVRMPGGELEVHVAKDREVILRGPVELVGRFELASSWLDCRRN